ncbi:phosphoribosylamine--glycine ligase [Thiotrichales bacterium 19S9-12]|nr:phosphoribosylamine--glycine ligase [Thiotrichales bacterium 19S9-11]MCF6811144.1 phosphoribosylamine--glycine ligase [Thiotrichales bacterium 19S9-12]
MKILIVGNGGREHALAWKCAQSELVEEVFVAPGNAGTEKEENVSNIDISATDLEGLAKFAKKNNIDLTIVGPEQPLSLGIVDYFQEKGLKIFGPSQKASQLESSKAFSKDFMSEFLIPTAVYEKFNDPNRAKAYLSNQTFPIVIKASGLAQGKGVVIAQDLDQARNAVDEMLSGYRFGDAGKEIIIEDFLTGEEASFIVLCDGENAIPMATSQDHKALNDGDEGPNTGGMGAYSPAPVVTSHIHEKVMRTIIEPVLEGMKKHNTPYVGFLYAGLMIAPDASIKVLEFNCRFGDPETQPIMMRLESDLVELILAALDGNIDKAKPQWSNQSALGVVLASRGYPETYLKGEEILGISSDNGKTNKIFHAGTSMQYHAVVTNGGRVLCVTALGDDIQQAHDNAYKLVERIHWDSVYYRKDIGMKAIKRHNPSNLD